MKKRYFLFFKGLILFFTLPVNCAAREHLGELEKLPDEILLELAIASTENAKSHREALSNAENFLSASRYLENVIKPRFYKTKSIQDLQALARFEKNQLLLEKYKGDFLKHVGQTADLPNEITKPYAAFKQSDGKVLVVGTKEVPRGVGPSAEIIAMVRLNIDGSLDTSFGSKGVVLTDMPNTDQDGASTVAMQSDGKILVGGFSGTTGELISFLIARYNPDGSLDKTFNASGQLSGVTIWSPEDALANHKIDSAVGSFTALTVQPDGKIVAGGYYNNQGELEIAIARYNADGSLDKTFGKNGIAVGEKGTVEYIFVRPNNDIVVTYESNNELNEITLSADGKLQ